MLHLRKKSRFITRITRGAVENNVEDDHDSAGRIEIFIDKCDSEGDWRHFIRVVTTYQGPVDMGLSIILNNSFRGIVEDIKGYLEAHESLVSGHVNLVQVKDTYGVVLRTGELDRKLAEEEQGHEEREWARFIHEYYPPALSEILDDIRELREFVEADEVRDACTSLVWRVISKITAKAEDEAEEAMLSQRA